MMKNQLWSDVPFVALDIETTGGYPIGSEICEIGAVRWERGRVVDTFQTLIKPYEKMSDFIVGIHGITNEMVEGAPRASDVIADFYNFLKGAVHIAHHAPFDLGFLAYEFEKENLPLPVEPVLCTSLLSQSVFKEAPNHRLQTLINFLKLPKELAHRALEDAHGALRVFLKIAEKIGEEKTVEFFQELQRKKMAWQYYSISDIRREEIGDTLIYALESGKDLEVIYRKGHDPRKIRPVGVVRNPDGDYLQALCLIENREKRFYMDKFLSAKSLS